MTIAPHSGIVDFGTFTSPNAPLNGIQGEVPAPLVGQEAYVLTATGWAPGGGGGSVTAVTASSPLASSGGATPNIDFGGLTGTAGQYLQSTGTASPTWATISSGVGTTAYSGAFSDYTTQTIASTTTAYKMTFNTTDFSNGVTVVSGSRITVANAGTYNFQWSGQFQNTANQLEDVKVWVRINGVDVVGSTGLISIPNSHGGTPGHIIAGWNFYFTLNSGDYLELWWSATSTGVTIEYYSAGTSPTTPTTASLIATISQITQIGIGYYNLTSTTSNTIGTGSKTFTTNLNATNTAFTVGTRVRVAYQTSPSNFMEGVITAFSDTSMTVNVDSIGGSGTYALWTISVAGIQGSNGVTSFSAGLTGLTPSTATTGDITLAGLLGPTYGGTGVNNGSKTITLGGNFTTSGAYTTTLTATGNTSVTLPTSGYLLGSVNLPANNPVTGTPSSSNYLRGDGTWAAVPASSLTIGTTATSGGAVGQIMFDTGSVLQESSNLVWDNTNKKLTITGATVTTSQPVLDMTQTWNAAGVLFSGLKINITDTASNVLSGALEVQYGGSTYMRVGKGASGYSMLWLYPVITPTNANPTIASTSTSTYFQSSDTNGFAYLGNATAAGLGASSTIVRIGSGNSFGFTSGAVTTSLDTILTRRGAANLRFGAADAAAPVAQTLSVQSVVAGTTDTAGANLTITGSQGTGTGAGGSIIFQVAPAGSSGTAQNALSTALTINSAGQIIAASSGSVAAPAICLGGNINSGFYKLTNGFGYSTSASTTILTADYATGLRVLRDMHYGWTSAQFDGGTTDLFLTRRAAANLRFGAADAAAPVAQTLSVQSVVAGTTNTAGANLTITGSQGTGTGAGGSIIFQVAPAGSSGTAQNALSTALTIASTGAATFANTVNFNGAAVMNSNVNLLSGGATFVRMLAGSADGCLQLRDNAQTGWDRLQFGGTTSSFPALKRSSTILQVRLADDSAYAPVEASTVRTATAYTVATLPAAGTAGRRAYVTDALAPTFLGTLTGGGAVVTPVFDNGTAWVAG